MKYLAIFLVAALLGACRQSTEKNKEWIPLFNGKDLTGWDIKISGYPLNENVKNIFSIEDSILKVSYNQLDSFRGEFGHIFYRQKFSHYKLRLQYRFTDSQCPGGPEWGLRNSGVMIHSQSAESMETNQDFPVSIEVQFLGGLGTGERPTLNVCTPGTDIDILDSIPHAHCTNSRSRTFHGDQWVSAEIVVLGDSIIHHIVEGDTVISYGRPRIGPEMKPAGYSIPDGTPLKEGYIALQAESHNVEFRRVKIQILE
jgi:Domain of Unknown Function (DUF1080)